MEKGDVVSSLPKDAKRLGVITYKKGSELEITGYKSSEEKGFGSLNFVWMDKIK